MNAMTLQGFVSGKVQGVGFRLFVQRAAKKLNVTGYAKNLDDGRVEVLLHGSKERLWEMKKAVLQGPLLSNVQNCEWLDDIQNEELIKENIENFECY